MKNPQTPRIPQYFRVPSKLFRAQQECNIWDGICHVDPDPAPEPTPATPPEPLQQPGLDALRTERQRAKQLEQQLKAFEGIDPEKYREAMAIAQNQQEWAQRESELKSEFEKQYTPQIQERDTQIQVHRAALANYYADVVAEQAFLGANGIPGEFAAIAPTVQQRIQVDTSQLKFDPSGRLDQSSVKVQILDATGQPMFVEGKPAQMSDLLKELAEQHTWIARHFKGNDSPGLQLGGKGDYSAGNPAMKNLPAWERVNLQRQNAGT
ncbi:MAG: hypothetical protein AAFX78_03485 [Cyanobacteria bacterium J06638_20]